MWKPKYVVCYRNRTVGTEECSNGEYFHPRRRICLKPVHPGNEDSIANILMCLNVSKETLYIF